MGRSGWKARQRGMSKEGRGQGTAEDRGKWCMTKRKAGQASTGEGQQVASQVRRTRQDRAGQGRKRRRQCKMQGIAHCRIKRRESWPAGQGRGQGRAGRTQDKIPEISKTK